MPIQGVAIAKPSWKRAAAAQRWTASRRFGGASRASTRCCATKAWLESVGGWSRLFAVQSSMEYPMKSVSLRSMFAVVALLASLPGYAMYKVVGPDGKVTYTDVPPSGGASRVVPMGQAAATQSAPEVSIPTEL